MIKRYLIVLGAFILLTFSSCLKEIFCISGNGIEQTEVRRVMSFNKIENSIPVDVVYRKSDTTGITLVADENLLNHITTETNNNTLNIHVSHGSTCLDFNTKPIIKISSPSLNSVFLSGSSSFFADEMSGKDVSIKMSGSGDISIDKISGTELTVALSGSGNIKVKNCIIMSSDIFLSGSGKINLSGQSESSSLRISGSGEINAENLMLSSADIIISGSGDAYTYVDKSLNAVISGSGNIYLKGDPAISKTISGTGRIIKYK